MCTTRLEVPNERKIEHHTVQNRRSFYLKSHNARRFEVCGGVVCLEASKLPSAATPRERRTLALALQPDCMKGAPQVLQNACMHWVRRSIERVLQIVSDTRQMLLGVVRQHARRRIRDHVHSRLRGGGGRMTGHRRHLVPH